MHSLQERARQQWLDTSARCRLPWWWCCCLAYVPTIGGAGFHNHPPHGRWCRRFASSGPMWRLWMRKVGHLSMFLGSSGRPGWISVYEDSQCGCRLLQHSVVKRMSSRPCWQQRQMQLAGNRTRDLDHCTCEIPRWQSTHLRGRGQIYNSQWHHHQHGCKAERPCIALSFESLDWWLGRVF